MKAYILFAGQRYYPQGGMDDYKGSFDSVDDAITAVEKNNKQYDDYWNDVEGAEHTIRWEWWHVVQTSDMTCVTDSEG